jgi:polyhydroxyalkanoate synthesis regulator phasin
VKTQLELIEDVPMSTDGTYHLTKAQRDYLVLRAQGMEAAGSRIRTLERQVERLEGKLLT